MSTPSGQTARRKLIEVSLPLEDINAESAREKSIRHGHPSTLHLWWARRPLAAARAVLFAQLVDDPSSNPELTEEEQKAERERLHDLIRRLVKWENINDETLMREAYEEILKSTDGHPPAILDPFAGGGTIPLEAQRLGLEAHASDLNPVAVLINKALIEIPPKLAGRPPVFPGAADSAADWPRATGLAEDVRRYGAWMREEAKARIGHLYPDANIVDDKTGQTSTATTIAWIWARTVTCPNPACGIEMPLVRSWWLGKKKGKEAFIVPALVKDPSAPAGRRVVFEVCHDGRMAPLPGEDGTSSGGNATCIGCKSTASAEYVRSEGRAGRMGEVMTAVVVEGPRGRTYISVPKEHSRVAKLDPPRDLPLGSMPASALGFRIQNYGYGKWSQVFTPRQLVMVRELFCLAREAGERSRADLLSAMGVESIDQADSADEYARAISTYLALVVSRMLDRHSKMTTWDNGPQKEYERSAFAGPKIQMSADFVESNPFGGAGADFASSLSWLEKALINLPSGSQGSAVQADAAARSYTGYVISTDPPYYDNVGYASLSDFFYVWLRKSLRADYPDIFASLLTPKEVEIVAEPARHGGAKGAEKFFEDRFVAVFESMRAEVAPLFPLTVYYAFKQQELRAGGLASTGWATILEGVVRSGWVVTATWPIASEMKNRLRGIGSNALASSVVLVLRPRQATAGQVTRKGFLTALKRELPGALEQMRQGAIAPVDLAQATIGPGMAVFSRYERVVENDGTDMPVKTALALINQVLDEVLSEQEGDLDPDTRFCVKWYEQFGWSAAAFGEADVLARAYNTSVQGLADAGVLTQGDGHVQLVRPEDLDPAWNPTTDHRISEWEVMLQLGRVLSSEDGGVDAAARLMAAAGTRSEIDLESVQRLAYRLYEMVQKSRPDDARLFNLLGGSWSDLVQATAKVPTPVATQDSFDFEDEER